LCMQGNGCSQEYADGGRADYIQEFHGDTPITYP
jgi:hypothetical protein